MAGLFCAALAAAATGCVSTNELWEPERDFTTPPLFVEIKANARAIGERRAPNGSRELVVDCKDLDGALVLREPTEGAFFAWDMVVRTDYFEPTRVRIVFDRVLGSDGRLRKSDARLIMEGALDTTPRRVPARASYDELLRRRDRDEVGVSHEALRLALLAGIQSLAVLSGEKKIRHAGVALVGADLEPLPVRDDYEAEALDSLGVLIWRWDGEYGVYYVVPVPVVLLASQFTQDPESGRPLPVLESTWQATLAPAPEGGDFDVEPGTPIEVVYREYRARPRYSVHGFVNRVARTPVAATKDLARAASRGFQYAGKAFKDLKGDLLLQIYAIVKGRARMPNAPPKGQ